MDAMADLTLVASIARCGSLTATAQELGVTTPAISRRLAALEQRLGVALFARTTRTLALTPEGERYLQAARRILDDIGELERSLRGSHAEPQGLLRVNATFGFGRRHIAPAIALFAARHPQLSVQLSLTERMPAPGEGSFDVSIRFGPPPDARLCAQRIVHNRRILCAAPAYLQQAAPIRQPQDLSRQQCLFVRENDAVYGQWQLQCDGQQQRVRVSGRLSANDGESVVGWAGRPRRDAALGWDVGAALGDGRRRVLPSGRSTPADICAVPAGADAVGAGAAVCRFPVAFCGGGGRAVTLTANKSAPPELFSAGVTKP
jgi:DNA-binding transcriptional LysR family regulator